MLTSSLIERQQALCVGDYVTLYSEEYHGFVFSYQSSIAFAEIGIAKDQSCENPILPTSEAVVFQICSPNRYKFNKQLPKLKAQLDQNPDDIALQSQHAHAKQCADAEEQDNQFALARQLGSKLTYGQLIQLRHLFSAKYVHVNSAQTSFTEKSNMMVELRSQNAKEALFRIMPRYKLKQEGEAVQAGDLIVFESAKSAGQFLRCSRHSFGQKMTYSTSNELNLSVRPSGFSIFLYQRPMKPPKATVLAKDRRLKGGSVIRLFHREVEAYVVADAVFGSNASQNTFAKKYEEFKFCSELDETLVHLHMRVRPIDQSASSSAITFWQLEKQRSSIDGSVIHWEDQVLLRHMTSRRYLSVTAARKVSLSSNREDPMNVFRIHSVVKDSDVVFYDSFVRIQHAATGMWLHADENLTYTVPGKTAEASSSSMASLNWTTAELKQLTVTKEMMYDDGFNLQKVAGNIYLDANFAAGSVPSLHKFMFELGNGSLFSPRKVQPILTAIRELNSFLMLDDSPCKSRQKLLRNFMVIDMVIELLKIQIKGTENEKIVEAVFAECFSLLHTYLLGTSKKNKVYLSRHFDFLVENLVASDPNNSLNAATVIVELLKDNRRMLDRITANEMEKFCKLLENDKRSRYLELLNVLCTCNGQAIEENQNFIVDRFLVKAVKKSKNAIFYTNVGEKLGLVKNDVYISTDGAATWQPLHEFGRLNKKSDAYSFLECQLQLYSSLADGRNEHAIEVITKQLECLTWQEALICLKDDRLSDKLRAIYCKLILELFIDIGTNSSALDRQTLVFVYDDIALPGMPKRRTAGESIQLTMVPLPFANELRDWISKFLTDNRTMFASKVGRNKLIQEVLRLIYHLMLFGYFGTEEEFKKLLDPMLDMIDGTSDLPFPTESKQAENRDIKQAIAEYKTTARFKVNGNAQALVDAKCEALRVIDLFYNYRFNTRLERFLSEFKLTVSQEQKKAKEMAVLGPLLYDGYEVDTNNVLNRNAVKKLKEMFAESKYFAADFVSILMDLCDYKYDKLTMQALSALNRYYSSRENLFARALDATVLVTEKSCQVYFKVHKIMPILKRQATSANLSSGTTETLTAIFDALAGYCVLENDKLENHPINQEILHNHGLVADIFDMLSRCSDSTLEDQYPNRQKVFTAAFNLLAALAKRNPTLQQRIFDRIGFLLKVDGVEESKADLLIDVFMGNAELCLQIQQSHVQDIVLLLQKTRNHQVVRLLEAIVLVGNLPVRRNQTMVMKTLLRYRHSVEIVVDSKKDERLALMTADESDKKILANQRYFGNIVSLFAVCSRGDNRTAESICQCIFTCDELLRYANLSELCAGLRRPFVKYLISVFLTSNAELAETDTKDIGHNSRLWDLLSSIVQDLNKATEFLSANKEPGKDMLRKPPSRLHVSKADTEHETKELLHYIFDAALPLIAIFFKRHYVNDAKQEDETASGTRDAEAEQQQQTEKTTMSALEESLWRFSKAAQPCIMNPEHRSAMTKAAKALLSAEGKRSILPPELMHGLQDAGNSSAVRFKTYYKEELELNAMLKTFSANMKAAYEGPNTVRAQIAVAKDDEYCVVGTEDGLPLGAEFQEIAKCFVDVNEFKPKKRYKRIGKILRYLTFSVENMGDGTLSEKARVEQEQLNTKYLQVLRALLHNEIVKLPEERKENSKLYDHQLASFKAVQTAMLKMNVVGTIIPHCSVSNQAISTEALALLAKLLFTDAKLIQDSFLEYCLGNRNELFFLAVKAQIQTAAGTMKERKALVAQYQSSTKENEAFLKSLTDANDPSRPNSRRSSKAGLETSTKTSRIKQAFSFGRNSAKNKVTPSAANGIANGAVSIPIEMFSRNGDKDPLIMKEMAKGTSHPDQKKVSEKRQQFSDCIDAMLDFKDTTTGQIRLVLRVLEKLCDGQHGGMQEYLREQRDNMKSVDLVGETARFLSILYSTINWANIDLIISLLKTLIEISTGSPANQLVLFDQNVIDYTNFILRIEDLPGCTTEKVIELKYSVACLLRNMTEENSATNQAYLIMEAINSEDVLRTMEKCYQAMNQIQPVDQKKRKKRKSATDSDVELRSKIETVGFLFHGILQRATDLDQQQNHLIDTEAFANNEAWIYFRDLTKSVEVIKDNTVHKVYFQVRDPNVLLDSVRQRLKWEVNRSSPSNKLRDFLVWSADIRQDIRYQEKIHSHWPLRWLLKLWRPLNLGIFLWTLLINILLLLFWDAPDLYQPGDRPYSVRNGTWKPVYPAQLERPLLVISVIHNVLSMLLFVSYCLVNKPALPAFVVKSNDENSFETFRFITTSVKMRIFLKDKMQNWGEGKIPVKGIVASCAEYCRKGDSAAFLLSNCIAWPNYGILLGKSLIFVVILGFVWFYIFALIGFLFLRDIYSSSSLYCGNLWECYVTTIRHGIMNSLQNFEIAKDNPEASFAYYALKALFDLAFFAIILTIGLNMIFGIIVDTFSELRNEKWQIESDMAGTCFICSKSSYEFEHHHPQGFLYHVLEEHNMWAYLYYFIYLDETPPQDHSSIEGTVYKAVQEERTDFFPVGKALSLAAWEEQTTDGRIEILLEQVNQLVAKAREEDAQKARNEEKLRQQQWAKRYAGIHTKQVDTKSQIDKLPPLPTRKPPRSSKGKKPKEDDSAAKTDAIIEKLSSQSSTEKKRQKP